MTPEPNPIKTPIVTSTSTTPNEGSIENGMDAVRKLQLYTPKVDELGDVVKTPARTNGTVTQETEIDGGEGRQDTEPWVSIFKKNRYASMVCL